MKQKYLTKSDFLTAQSCPAKLYYKKNKYPDIKEFDDYLQLLAEGGYMVSKMAQLLHPGGVDVESINVEAAIEKTKENLKAENIILFEPTFFSNDKLIRADILIKNGNKIDLIEVKAKSYDSNEGKRLFVRKKKDWEPYLLDVAFQVYIINELHPEIEITPYLMLHNKAERTNIEGLASWFRIKESKENNKYFEVEFAGNLDELRKERILIKVDIKDEVGKLIPKFKDNLGIFIDSIANNKKIQSQLTKECKECEYRANHEDTRDGFRECWGPLADVKPHIFDLYHMGTLGNYKLANELISQGKVSMYDIPYEKLTGESRGKRQKIQVENTRLNKEWVSENLKSELQKFEYPLYFIDFETCNPAIPLHKGMRPYEQIGFQWSCHTITEPDAKPIHEEWLNIENKFPNFKFARSLMEHIGNNGTVFMWATHENNILKAIYEQIEIFGHKDDELRLWLNDIVKFDPKDEGRLIDMDALTRKHYFHPEMKGKTSLKAVLPAVWKNNSYLHEIPWLKEYYAKEGDTILDPYKVLSQIDIAGKAEVVNEGTGAMRAYEEMLFGLHRDDEEAKTNWSKILKQYCKLDTMAMVIVWLHWNYLISEKR